MSSFDGGDTIHRVAGTGMALGFLFAFRWAVAALPFINDPLMKLLDALPFSRYLAMVANAVFGAVEVIMVTVALSVSIGMLDSIWQVYVSLINGDGVSGFSDMDVLTFNVCAAAVCIFAMAMHPITIFRESEEPNSTPGTASWRESFSQYAQGLEPRSSGFHTVLGPRTWSSAFMAAFVALASNQVSDKKGRTAAIVVFATTGWVIWLGLISLLGYGADMFHSIIGCGDDSGSSVRDRLYMIHASAASGLAVIVIYTSSRLWDKFSWVETLQGTKADSESIAIIGAVLAGTYALWVFFGHRTARLISDVAKEHCGACCKTDFKRVSTSAI